jgi:hypothetical protein
LCSWGHTFLLVELFKVLKNSNALSHPTLSLIKSMILENIHNVSNIQYSYLYPRDYDAYFTAVVYNRLTTTYFFPQFYSFTCRFTLSPFLQSLVPFHLGTLRLINGMWLQLARTKNKFDCTVFCCCGTGVLNSGLHTCKAAALLLEPHLQPILLWLFLELGSASWVISACTYNQLV